MRFITVLFLLVTSFAYSQWTPYNVNMEVKGNFQANKNVYFKQGADSGKVWMCVHDSTGLGQWTTFTSGGSVDTSTLPFYHHITQIDSTTLSWDKLTGVKDTVEFIVSGISDNGFWKTTGNAGIDSTYFIGTTDAATLFFRQNNYNAGRIEGDATYNTAIGFASFDGGTGFLNSAFGVGALGNSPTGSNNTAMGISSLGSLTTGENNTAFGSNAGLNITTGSHNTMIGDTSAVYNSNAMFATAIGNGTRAASYSTALGTDAHAPSQHSVIIGDTTDTALMVGIGTQTPTAKLHVLGNFQLVDGTQGAGKVLTSDVNGLSIWGLVLDADTFSPTLTGVTNIDSLTTYPFQYMLVGNTVTVSGQIKMKITGTGAYEVGIELPIASDFTQTYQCAGNGTGVTTTPAASDNGYIKADIANNRASFNGDDNDTGYHIHYLTFTYTIQ